MLCLAAVAEKHWIQTAWLKSDSQTQVEDYTVVKIYWPIIVCRSMEWKECYGEKSEKKSHSIGNDKSDSKGDRKGDRSGASKSDNKRW